MDVNMSFAGGLLYILFCVLYVYGSSEGETTSQHDENYQSSDTTNSTTPSLSNKEQPNRCVLFSESESDYFTAKKDCEERYGSILRPQHLVQDVDTAQNVSDALQTKSIWFDEDGTAPCMVSIRNHSVDSLTNVSCSEKHYYFCVYSNATSCPPEPSSTSTYTPIITTVATRRTTIPPTPVPPNLIIAVAAVVVVLVVILIIAGCFIKKPSIKPAREERGHHVYDLPDVERPPVVRDESTGVHHYDHLGESEPTLYTTLSPQRDQSL